MINLPINTGKQRFIDGTDNPESVVDDSRGVRGQADLFQVPHSREGFFSPTGPQEAVKSHLSQVLQKLTEST